MKMGIKKAQQIEAVYRFSRSTSSLLDSTRPVMHIIAAVHTVLLKHSMMLLALPARCSSHTDIMTPKDIIMSEAASSGLGTLHSMHDASTQVVTGMEALQPQLHEAKAKQGSMAAC